MAEIHGVCDSRFEALRDLLSASLDAGDDLGASVAVTLDGAFVVDLWGGWSDADRSVPWGRDTITNVWSSTKPITALAALVLASAGELDLDARVAHYWPEFAANGKADVLVRHLLSHTSGVSGWEQPITVEDLYDWEESTARLAAQEPWWEPGTASGYHMINYGHLIGEVIRRITGQQLGAFVARTIAQPLGADFHIGLPATEDHRVSNIIPPPTASISPAGAVAPADQTSVQWKTTNGPLIHPATACTEAWRRADIGAGNGHGNARSVARLQSLLSCRGEVDGIRLMLGATCDRVFEEQSNGPDLVVGVPFRLGLGYGLTSGITPHLPDGRVCWWGGWGGSLVTNDLDRRMTFAYMMNRMGPSDGTDWRAARLVMAAYAALGVVH